MSLAVLNSRTVSAALLLPVLWFDIYVYAVGVELLLLKRTARGAMKETCHLVHYL